MSKPKSGIEVARDATAKPLIEIGKKLGIPADSLMPYGHTKSTPHYEFIRSLNDRPNGKLILVTAISPTPARKGKTTTTVGLRDGHE